MIVTVERVPHSVIVREASSLTADGVAGGFEGRKKNGSSRRAFEFDAYEILRKKIRKNMDIMEADKARERLVRYEIETAMQKSESPSRPVYAEGKIRRRYTPEWMDSGTIKLSDIPRFVAALESQHRAMVEYIGMLHDEIDNLLADMRGKM